MSIDDVKILYWISIFILCLTILSPLIAMVVSLPGGERFSELWLLGGEHMIEGYPHNVKENETYRVYLGVGNHMGDMEYYLVYIKFRNSTEPLPDTMNSTPSPLPSLYEYRFFLDENQIWESELVFSFFRVLVEGNVSKVEGISINDRSAFVNKTAVWDEEHRGFYYQIFFELWRYDVDASGFEFHDRFVGLRLNMTA